MSADDPQARRLDELERAHLAGLERRRRPLTADEIDELERLRDVVQATPGLERATVLAGCSTAAGRDINRERWRNALILHFQAAVALRNRLEDCPRWRRHRRRKLERDLTRECNRADLAARILGAGPDARPLRSILDEAIGDLRARR